MPANHNVWNPADMAILVAHYQTLGPDYVAEQTGRPVHLVRAKAWRLGLSATGAEEWSEQELEQLRRHYPLEGADYVVELTGRPRTAVLTKAKRLGIRCGNPAGHPRWSEEEDSMLKADYPTGSLPDLMARLGRNLDAVRQRAALFGLKRVKRAKPAPAPKVEKPALVPTPAPPVAKVKPTPAPKKPVLSQEEKELKKLVRNKAKAKKEKKAKPEPPKKGWQYPMHSPEYNAWLASTTAGRRRTTILDENGRPATVWRKEAA